MNINLNKNNKKKLATVSAAQQESATARDEQRFPIQKSFAPREKQLFLVAADTFRGLMRFSLVQHVSDSVKKATIRLANFLLINFLWKN